ncbi:ATP-binding protein [Adhaeribacter radiodurans]|uniref:histidine kinase n=1 Tax=Adhaeribacter radiodurans TaxID=2745197 RepID=A0A7L7LDG3_9BACT|nr:ATP-binding protein [Adhaeribacter radiodurans]QMU30878.1 GAF domain-containing protein [Adhaeribacter radiodurans]
MKNYKNYLVDLTNCDKEPIHIIGRIQPHGFLLVIDKVTHAVEQVSDNLATFTGFDPEDVISAPLQSLLTAEEYCFIAEIVNQELFVQPQLISWRGQPFFGFFHFSGDKIILECEPYNNQPDNDQLRHNNRVAQLSQQLNQMEDLTHVAKAVALAMAEVLAYDRVEVIQFDPEWNSEVIGEAHNSSLPAYLGHHFPASDIPAPARELLLKKHIRQIPDVHAEAAEIIPYHNSVTGAPTNILLSELRNPSEIHLEYVKNMGVAATISFSILVKGKLWGLISCHNVKPVFLNVWQRQVGDLITKTFANVILSIQEKRDVKQWARYRHNEELLINQINQSKDIRAGLLHKDLTLLTITESTGAALFLDNKLTTFGQVPTEEQMLHLINWLTANEVERMFCTRELSKRLPEAVAYRNVASGLLALEISRYNKEYLLFYKPEMKETRVWAGNPEQPKMGADLRLHPRKSFEKWEEEIKGKSLPWSLNEQEITQTLLKDIIAIQLRNQASELESLNKGLTNAAGKLQAKNTQLEDFAFIMSHNLKSPLNNINGLHQVYQQEPNPEMATMVLDRIKLVSDNMAKTIDDLNVILKTRIDNQLPWEEIYLPDLILKETQNLAAIIEQTQAEVQIDLQAPFIYLPKIYAESILHNFLSNALKYRSPSRKPYIQVKSWFENARTFLSVTDNGLGMDLDRMGSKLFGLYKTFHRHEHAKGLGLYLTKLQIEALGGEIKVASEPDKGTTFTVSFSTVGD